MCVNLKKNNVDNKIKNVDKDGRCGVDKNKNNVDNLGIY